MQNLILYMIFLIFWSFRCKNHCFVYMIFLIFWQFQSQKPYFVYDILDILTIPMQKTLFCIWYSWYFDHLNAKNIILHAITLTFWSFKCKKRYFACDNLDILTSRHHWLDDLAVLGPRPWEITKIKVIACKIMFFTFKWSKYQGYRMQNNVFCI
jgi:hypothetical protein